MPLNFLTFLGLIYTVAMKKTKELPKPRVYLVHRPDSEFVLVLRRGPSQFVGLFGWNRITNKITEGQWLKGVIFPRRCDISPNGNHIIYFASNYAKANQETPATWTVVSYFPYLKALDFWAKGDSWNGGGLFYSNKNYLLHEYGEHHSAQMLSNKFKISRGMPKSPIDNNECLGVYVPKLIRDNWELLDKTQDSIGGVYTFSKRINNDLTILKILHATSTPPQGKGCYFEEHFIEGVVEGRSDFRDIEYLDYYNDNGKIDDMIFWSEEGEIRTSLVVGSTIQEPVTVKDFSEYKYSRIKAPY